MHPCTKCGVPLEQETTICPSCGEFNFPGTPFSKREQKIGADFTASEETPLPPNSKTLSAQIGRRKWWLLILVAVLFVAYVWLSSVIWYSPEIRARVVTPDGRPVVGAIVVANCELRGGIHGIPLGQLAVVEVVTDKDGEFRIAQWGPLFLPSSYGGYKYATLRIFSPNFVPLVANDFDHQKSLNPEEISRESLQKGVLELKPFQGPLAQYDNELAYLAQSFSFFEFSTDQCAW